MRKIVVNFFVGLIIMAEKKNVILPNISVRLTQNHTCISLTGLSIYFSDI